MVGAWWHRWSKDHRASRQSGDEADADDLDDETASLLSMLPLCSIVVDADDEVIRCNPQAYRFNVVRDDAIVDKAVLEAVDRVRRTGGKETFDLTTHTAPGRSDDGDAGAGVAQGVSRPNWLKVSVGRVGGFVIVLLNDVSDAVRFAETRDSFITNVSEQLLRPTAALERLSFDIANSADDPARIAEDAGEVRHTSRRLNRMVSDLLLLIKAQEPIVPSSANRLSLLGQAREVVDALSATAKGQGIKLALGGDRELTVNGDGDQIRVALTKLVENAIGYSNEGGTVNVAVAKTKDGAHAVVRVIDQGVGIPKAEQERVFERFYRGSQQNDRTADGIGLGLAIVKHVALTHHGTVAVWSMPGSGSTFTLTLPLAQ
ncbi:ATP-binding protein [Bifidobacterium avesanii]|uniref:Sensor-like histidine kinase SenX3 n=1 Tax=Bifidobacterium avesanii TaxID=1798157 RepID=A0A7K3TG78_9BIFI|nr:ATPase [Bifidobacterium avesanii]